MLRNIATVGLFTIGLGMLVGCNNDPGRTRARAAIASMQDVRQQMQAGIRDVEEVQATLKAMQNSSLDQRMLYDQYRQQVAAVRESAQDIDDEIESMRDRAQEYRQAWQREAATISDPDLRSAANERASKVKDRFDTIFADYRETQDAYYPFINKLRDVETFLSNDLTAAGINAARPAMQDAVKAGDTLKQKARKVVDDLSQATPKLSPATSPGNRSTTTKPAAGS